MLLFCAVGSLWEGRRGLDAWWIGLLGGGEAGRSPKGARKRGGLDVEAAGKQAEVQKEQEIVVDWTLKLWGSMVEVQKEQESVVDWTLKLRGSRQKSKRSK